MIQTLLIKEGRLFFYLFIVTLNIVERQWNKFFAIITYVTAAIKSRSFVRFAFFSLEDASMEHPLFKCASFLAWKQ